MKNLISSFLVLMILGSLFSCEKEKKEDAVTSVNKKEAIETELSVEHIDSADVLITKHKVWKDNKLVKEIIKKDTIPSLGDTLQTSEDKDGNAHTGKTKKDYEFYITVQ